MQHSYYYYYYNYYSINVTKCNAAQLLLLLYKCNKM